MSAIQNNTVKPPLLYISPVFPDVQGNGLAMRSSMFLEALAERYYIDLMVVSIFDDPEKPVPELLSRFCRRVSVIHPQLPASRPPGRFRTFLSKHLLRTQGVERPWLWMFASPRSIRDAGSVFATTPYDVIHIFRLYMVPFASPYLKGVHNRRPVICLDIDDIESPTHARLAEAYHLNGDPFLEEFERDEGLRYERAERDILPGMDRVYVCSEMDRAELITRCPGLEIHVIPNAVRVPAPLPATQAGDRFTLLFIGTLGYYPNLDALGYFCQEILPLIQQRAPRPVEFWIVGNGTAAELQELASLPGVKLIGSVPEVAPYYQAAELVVAPLRTGGGTRIKVLEAFAHQRPLVSTTIGIEGIEAEPGIHLLTGDSPQEFAEGCVRILSDPKLKDELIRNAYNLVLSTYSMEAIRKIVTALPLPSHHP